MVEWEGIRTRNTIQRSTWLLCSQSSSLTHTNRTKTKPNPFFFFQSQSLSHFFLVRPLSLRCVAFIPVWCGGSFWSFPTPIINLSIARPISVHVIYVFFVPSPPSSVFPLFSLYNNFRVSKSHSSISHCATFPFASFFSHHVLGSASISPSALLLSRFRYSAPPPHLRLLVVFRDSCF